MLFVHRILELEGNLENVFSIILTFQTPKLRVAEWIVTVTKRVLAELEPKLRSSDSQRRSVSSLMPRDTLSIFLFFFCLSSVNFYLRVCHLDVPQTHKALTGLILLFRDRTFE